MTGRSRHNTFYFSRLVAALLLLGLWVGRPAPARAECLSTPRSLGMGGSLRAAATGASGIFLNPAGIAMIRSYVVTAFYDFHVRKNGHVAHSSVVDSVASKWVKAGLYYNLIIMRPDVYERGQQKDLTLKQDGHETGITMAMPLGSQFSLGITVKYQYYRARFDMTVLDDEDEPTIVEHEVDKISNIGVDLGLVLKITKGLTLGLTGMNLVPQKSIHAPISMGMGVAYSYKTYFMIALDTLLDFSSKDNVVADVYGGIEAFLARKYAVRAGAMYRGLTEGTYVTGGFGYVNPKAAIDIFLVQQATGGVETRIGFAMKLFVR